MLCLKVLHIVKALGDLICRAFSFSELLCSAESTKLSLTPLQFYLVALTQPSCVFSNSFSFTTKRYVVLLWVMGYG